MNTQVPQHKYKVLKLHGNGGIHLSRPRRFDGWLGSGCLDKNGTEIFEGDRVKVLENEIYIAEFVGGVFRVGNDLLNDFSEENLEVVGHVTE